ncbi:hypothetical protein [Sulfitobacter pontiacus]|uniref:hypothetical protein n=1 Tax=Sulfitobacter pontiacus TaxID=60137 RepID=UPI0030EF1650
MAKPRLTLTYIVEPPSYDIMACSLLASVREQFSEDVACIGYVPEHRMNDVHPSVFIAHEKMGAELRPMKTEGMWREPYPHGNKIIAAMQPRESEFSAFVDSDVLFIRPNTIDNIVKSGHVSCSVAASMYWAQKDIWDLIYGAFDMEIPEERVYLMRQSRRPKVPYFSSGFVLFPEAEGPQGRFADVWYETARRIDEIDTLEKRRPYLDQMSLPVAIRRAGLTWNPLAEEQHYILGGKIRGEPLPEDRDIYTVHYRNPKVLEEVGLKHKSRRMLRRQTGVSFVRRLTRTDEPTAE